MKKYHYIGAIALLLTQPTQAQSVDSLFDTAKSLFTSESAEAPASKSVLPNATDMVSMLTNSLGVNNTQAEGGLGSLFNYAKSNLPSGDFSQLESLIPGTEDLLSAVPQISDDGSKSSGFGGLLDKASKYSDSLGSLNDLNKQFETLGLSPEMIAQFANTALQYLDTDEGQQARQLLQEAFSSLVN